MSDYQAMTQAIADRCKIQALRGEFTDAVMLLLLQTTGHFSSRRLTTLLRKLGVANRTQAIVQARARALL
jgi:hypothetical protein